MHPETHQHHRTSYSTYKLLRQLHADARVTISVDPNVHLFITTCPEVIEIAVSNKYALTEINWHLDKITHAKSAGSNASRRSRIYTVGAAARLYKYAKVVGSVDCMVAAVRRVLYGNSGKWPNWRNAKDRPEKRAGFCTIHTMSASAR